MAGSAGGVRGPGWFAGELMLVVEGEVEATRRGENVRDDLRDYDQGDMFI